MTQGLYKTGWTKKNLCFVSVEFLSRSPRAEVSQQLPHWTLDFHFTCFEIWSTQTETWNIQRSSSNQRLNSFQGLNWGCVTCWLQHVVLPTVQVWSIGVLSQTEVSSLFLVVRKGSLSSPWSATLRWKSLWDRALSVEIETVQIGVNEAGHELDQVTKKPEATLASGVAGFMAWMRSARLGLSPSLGSAFCLIDFIFRVRR